MLFNPDDRRRNRAILYDQGLGLGIVGQDAAPPRRYPTRTVCC
jgi:hypothetical protein